MKHTNLHPKGTLVICADCATSRDMVLAIKLLDPFQRKHWPKWWPKTESMMTGVIVHTGRKAWIEYSK